MLLESFSFSFSLSLSLITGCGGSSHLENAVKLTTISMGFRLSTNRNGGGGSWFWLSPPNEPWYGDGLSPVALPGAGVVAVTDEAGIRPDFLLTWLVIATFWKLTRFRPEMKIVYRDKLHKEVCAGFCWFPVRRFEGNMESVRAIVKFCKDVKLPGSRKTQNASPTT